jgi:hypothetical protein
MRHTDTSDFWDKLPELRLGSVFDDLQLTLELAELATDLAEEAGAPELRISAMRRWIDTVRNNKHEGTRND